MTTVTATAEKQADILGMDYFDRHESAINTIATIMGFTVTDLIAERNKENPDRQKIEELEKAYDHMSDERQAIYGGDEYVMQSVEERYAPIIRERLANA
jgi:cupin superfamily acireductone dioxygenase involved in methionine salvage